MPTSKYDWNEVSQLRRDRIADAEKYAERLNRGLGFYEWLHVGDGLIEWRQAALELAGTQDVAAQAYRDAHRAAKPFYPHLTSITDDKAVRKHAIWMTENRTVLESWYAGLGDKQRRNWNHPRTIWNHSPLGQAAKAAQREPKPRQSVVRDLAEQVDRVASAADQIERTNSAQQLIGDLSSSEMIDATLEMVFDIYVPAYGEDAVRSFFERGLARLTPQPETAPLDPAFAKSIARPRKRQMAPKAERQA
jgi:hypothetical protein